MIEASARHTEPVVQRVGHALFKADAGYAALSPAVKDDVLAFVAHCASVWFRTLLDRTPPTEAELGLVNDMARRRVHQEVSLSSILLAARIGSRELWTSLLADARGDAAARDALVLAFSGYLLEFFDGLASRISASYLDEQFQRSRWRDGLRYDLLNCIFGFPDDAMAFGNATSALDLDPAGPRACLALEVTFADISPVHLEGELDRLLLAASRLVDTPADQLVRAFYRERVVIWVPAAPDESLVVFDQRMQQLGNALVAAVACIKRIGVGLMNRGARGWSTSMDEAFRALDQGPRLAPHGNVFPFSDIALSESLLRNEAGLRYLDAIMERLSHEPGLLAALGAYFDEGQHRKRASEKLGIHANTLDIRLQRVEQLTGGSLADLNCIARLKVALTLRRATERG
jgi:sugar diacid utilization regulator